MSKQRRRSRAIERSGLPKGAYRLPDGGIALPPVTGPPNQHGRRVSVRAISRDPPDLEFTLTERGSTLAPSRPARPSGLATCSVQRSPHRFVCHTEVCSDGVDRLPGGEPSPGFFDLARVERPVAPAWHLASIEVGMHRSLVDAVLPSQSSDSCAIAVGRDQLQNLVLLHPGRPLQLPNRWIHVVDGRLEHARDCDATAGALTTAIDEARGGSLPGRRRGLTCAPRP